MAQSTEKILAQAKYYHDSYQSDRVLTLLEKHGTQLLDEKMFWYYRTWAYYRKDDNEKARKSSKEGLKLSPNDIDFLYVIGMTFAEEDQLDSAEAIFLQCLQIDPDRLAGIGGMLYVSGKRKKTDLFTTYEQKSLPHTVESTYICTMLIRGSYYLGDRERVKKYSQLKLNLSPDDSFAHRFLGWALYKEGDIDEAEVRFKTAIQTDAENSYLQKMLREIDELQTSNEKSDAMKQYMETHLLMRPIHILGNTPLKNLFLAMVFTLFLSIPFEFDGILSIISLFLFYYTLYVFLIPKILRIIQRIRWSKKMRKKSSK